MKRSEPLCECGHARGECPHGSSDPKGRWKEWWCPCRAHQPSSDSVSLDLEAIRGRYADRRGSMSYFAPGVQSDVIALIAEVECVTKERDRLSGLLDLGVKRIEKAEAEVSRLREFVAAFDAWWQPAVTDVDMGGSSRWGDLLAARSKPEGER